MYLEILVKQFVKKLLLVVTLYFYLSIKLDEIVSIIVGIFITTISHYTLQKLCEVKNGCWCVSLVCVENSLMVLVIASTEMITAIQIQNS